MKEKEVSTIAQPLPFADRRRAFALIAVLYVCTRALALAASMRYLSNESSWLIQLLDFNVLQHHLLRGLWHLHGQPPLFNVLIGVALKLAGKQFGWVVLGLQFTLGLAADLAVYETLILLRVEQKLALAVTLLLVLSPALILYEFDALYTSLVYALLCLLALALVNYVRSQTNAALCGFLGLLITLTLLRSSYQWVLILALAGLLGWQMRDRRRQILYGTLAAVALALVWPAKNFVQFRHFTTTTWGSYSLSRHWANLPGEPRVEAWVQQGRLPTFAEPESLAEEQPWLKKNYSVPPSGYPELDDLGKQSGGSANWNSLTMLKMHDAQAKDVRYLMLHDWHQYLHGVAIAVITYFRPSEDYFILNSYLEFWHPSVVLYQHMEPVDRPLLRICCNIFGFQRPLDNAAQIGTLRVFLWRLQGLSVAAVICYLLVFACGLSLWLMPDLWSGDDAARIAAMVMISIITYAFLVVSAFEIGENMRFRLETHGLVMIVSAVFLDRVWKRRSELRHRASGGPQAQSAGAGMSEARDFVQ